MKIKNAILDLLFPRICPFCNTPYTIDSWSCNCDYRQYLIEESKNKKGLKNTEGVRLLCVDKAVAIYYYKGNTKKFIDRLSTTIESPGFPMILYVNIYSISKRSCKGLNKIV